MHYCTLQKPKCQACLLSWAIRYIFETIGHGSWKVQLSPVAKLPPLWWDTGDIPNNMDADVHRRQFGKQNLQTLGTNLLELFFSFPCIYLSQHYWIQFIPCKINAIIADLLVFHLLFLEQLDKFCFQAQLLKVLFMVFYHWSSMVLAAHLFSQFACHSSIIPLKLTSNSN